MKSLFEQNGGTYSEVNGYLIPNLVLPDEPEYPIGVWGQRRLNYLKNHKKGIYTILLTSCKLNQHLHEIDERADEMLEVLMKQMAEKQGITEQLKATDQMAWVGAMNNIKACAMEFVYDEVIYTKFNNIHFFSYR